MKRLQGYLCGAVTAQRRTFSRLPADEQQFSIGMTAVILIGLLYTLTVAGLAAAHAAIGMKAWIPVPAKSYYFYEMLFTLPRFPAGMDSNVRPGANPWQALWRLRYA
ncbi:hypothetical protein CEB3_c40770 [Peptococcaceae bacterium CEB3]|nr:hypothetical protein CEB3_c40770 [Peptococcaceae bacterium CEB3]